MSVNSPRNSDLRPSKQGVVYKALFNAAAHLGLQTSELENVTGLSQPTLSRLKQATANGVERAVNPKSFENILLFLRLFRSLDSIFGGNVEQSKLWLNGKNFPLKGRPIELIYKTEGLVRVVSYLDAMRAKV